MLGKALERLGKGIMKGVGRLCCFGKKTIFFHRPVFLSVPVGSELSNRPLSPDLFSQNVPMVFEWFHMVLQCFD